jgi:hypothetical protein
MRLEAPVMGATLPMSVDSCAAMGRINTDDLRVCTVTSWIPA